MNLSFEAINNNLKALTITQLNQTKNVIKGLIKEKTKEFRIDYEQRPHCVYCNSSIIKKNGKTKNNVQRYICLNTKCNKSFSSNSDSFLYGSKKLGDYIYQMIEYTLDGLSIRNISNKINIPITTVWTWRTKINLLLNELIDKENKLSKVFYSDETYLKINLKGTKKHKMPRKSYESKKASVARRELVCIQTVLDDTKRTVFKINGVAKLTSSKLVEFVRPLLQDGSTLVTDGEPAYIGFGYDNYFIHERILDYKEKSKNGYSLGPINNLHSSFKFFMSKYRGVSTKRLEGYINLFVLTFILKQALKPSEIVNYVYESLLDLKNNLTNDFINKVKYPVDVENIYKELRNEGLIE